MEFKDNKIISEKMLKLSLNLEGTLRNFLKCHYTDFGVKNELLLGLSWTKPINFVLKRKLSHATDQRKSEIKDFLEKELKGENMEDLVNHSESYRLGDKNGALKYISQTITKIQYLLSDEI